MKRTLIGGILTSFLMEMMKGKLVPVKIIAYECISNYFKKGGEK